MTYIHKLWCMISVLVITTVFVISVDLCMHVTGDLLSAGDPRWWKNSPLRTAGHHLRHSPRLHCEVIASYGIVMVMMAQR